MTHRLPGALTVLTLVLTLSLLVPDVGHARPAPEARHRAAQQTVVLKPALRQVLRKVNAVRARHDRKPLKVRACLVRRFAQPWARHMADTGQMVHQDLNPIFAQCPGFSRVGENIAAGYTTPAAVMSAWMHSPGHRSNILRRGYTRIGLGLARADDGTRYWVQDFGG